MKVLLINKFLYPKGGDAISTFKTYELLKERGHHAELWGMSHSQNWESKLNKFFIDEINYNNKNGFIKNLKLTFKVLYSFEAKLKIRDLLREYKPDIVHLNNFAHQISPSILDVFWKEKISCVMTMHDYKLVCPVYTLFRNGKVCELCAGKKFYNCFLYRCAKDSYIKSLLNTLEMYLHHSLLDIYDKIEIFIAPSKFLKEKVKEMGFQKDVRYLPNFLSSDHFQKVENIKPKKNQVCYSGRLSTEKGLITLLKAMEGIPAKLVIVGDGPERKKLENFKESLSLQNVEFLGYKNYDELCKIILESLVTITPSEWYENNSRLILESMGLGRAVIGANIGGIPEQVIEGKTGYLFEVGNVYELKKKILKAIENPEETLELGRKAREIIINDYNPEKHYQQLINIYNEAIEKRKKRK